MKESLGISMDGMGRIFSYTAALSAIVYFPLGWLCDRISPVKVAVGALIGLCLCPLAGYFWVQTRGDYIAYSLMFILPPRPGCWPAWQWRCCCFPRRNLASSRAR